MESFVNMSIDRFLELQKEVKALREITEEITDDELIILHRCNSEFFRDISEEIEHLLFEFNEEN